MTNDTSPGDQRSQLADAFGSSLDPLASLEATFETTDIDPFTVFRSSVLVNREITARTRDGYDRVFAQWSEFMQEKGRHPACPATQHILEFIEHERDDRSNNPRTIKEKLRKLDDAFSYWQTDPAFPHTEDFDPFVVAKEQAALSSPDPKQPPKISLDKLRHIVQGVTNLRDCAIIVAQLKLGLRSTALTNIRLKDIALTVPGLADHTSLGEHSELDGYENAIYVPSRDERPGNKSQCPVLLPLDTELQRLLRRYLLVRPDCGQPWLFLSTSTYQQLMAQDVNKIWKGAFHPEYTETDDHRAVTSHYGRHRFTTYWRVQQDWPTELVKYMRGDTPGPATIDELGAFNHYVHPYYEDIRDRYLDEVFTLFEGENPTTNM